MCVFYEIVSGIFKNRLGSHGYTWFLACERRRISSRRFTFRAEGSNDRKSSTFAGHSNWDGILSKNPTGNLKFIKKEKQVDTYSYRSGSTKKYFVANQKTGEAWVLVP